MHFLPPFSHYDYDYEHAALEFPALLSVRPSVRPSVSTRPPSLVEAGVSAYRIGRHEDFGGGPRGLPRVVRVRERAVVQLPLGGGGQLVQARVRGPAALLPRVAASALSRPREGLFRRACDTLFTFKRAKCPSLPTYTCMIS